MDLKTLREQAIIEANDEFAENKIYDYKNTVKKYIAKISDNNAEIIALQTANEKLRKDLSEYELEEFKRVSI